MFSSKTFIVSGLTFRPLILFEFIFVYGIRYFQGKPFNITVIQVYAPTSNAEEAEVEPFYEDLQDLLEHPKKMSFLL